LICLLRTGYKIEEKAHGTIKKNTKEYSSNVQDLLEEKKSL